MWRDSLPKLYHIFGVVLSLCTDEFNIRVVVMYLRMFPVPRGMANARACHDTRATSFCIWIMLWYLSIPGIRCISITNWFRGVSAASHWIAMMCCFASQVLVKFLLLVVWESSRNMKCTCRCRYRPYFISRYLSQCFSSYYQWMSLTRSISSCWKLFFGNFLYSPVCMSFWIIISSLEW